MKMLYLVLFLALNNSFNVMYASGKKHNPQASSTSSYRGRQQKPAAPLFNSSKTKKESDDKNAKAKSGDKKKSPNKAKNVGQKKLVVQTEAPKILSKSAKEKELIKQKEQETPTAPSLSSLSRSATLSLEALQGTSAQTIAATASAASSTVAKESAAATAAVQTGSTQASTMGNTAASTSCSSSDGLHTANAIADASTQTQSTQVPQFSQLLDLDYNDGKVRWG